MANEYKQVLFCANLCVLDLSTGKLHESVEKVSELQRTGFSNTGIGQLDQRLKHLQGLGWLVRVSLSVGISLIELANRWPSRDECGLLQNNQDSDLCIYSTRL